MSFPTVTPSFWTGPFLFFVSALLLLPAHGEETLVTIKSAINQKEFSIQLIPGTAGRIGNDYILGNYFGGGNDDKRHGFNNQFDSHRDHFCQENEATCFESNPSDYTRAGALEKPDHNWLQGTTVPIIIDLGFETDKAIIFSSIDHQADPTLTNPDLATRRWNAIVEAVEFTVYGSNDFIDAEAVATRQGIFGDKGTESGHVPTQGIGSTFEKGILDAILEDGWKDFGAEKEGDDYASIWKFSKGYRFIAVYANYTDPFVGDGFQSEDMEIDAVGAYTPTGEISPP